jgi:diguanylate cyclase
VGGAQAKLPHTNYRRLSCTGELNPRSLLSRKDGLTGLNNRRTFLELAQLRLDESPFGVVILLDADHFKRVNDVYGHAVGDVCLKEIAHRLKWNLREIDVAGRIGGEEFAVLFANATIEQARVIAGRLGQPIPFRAEGQAEHLSVTLSMGAVLIEPEISLDALLVRADQALYAAKEAGRARLVFWSDPNEPAEKVGPKKSAA